MIFHLEAMANTDEFRDFLEGIDFYIREAIEIGVAINTSTNIEEIFPLVEFVDFVQVMGIEHIGFQGEEFDDRCLDNIKMLKEKFPDITISVDGGVNLENGARLMKAGADRLVAGSAIFNTDDIIGRVEELKNL